jgi:MFS family permease
MQPANALTVSAPLSRRWVFITLIATATFINYLDRGSLAVALPFNSRDLHLDHVQQGLALSSFFWTYAVMQIPLGWLVDRYDIKRVYAVAFVLWSLSAAATATLKIELLAPMPSATDTSAASVKPGVLTKPRTP